MYSIITRALRDKKSSLIIFCVAGILLLVLYIALFPSIQEQSSQMAKIFDSYPKAMLKILNVEDLNFSTIEKFLAIEQYSFTWPLLIIFLAVSFSGSLVRDIERGTIDFVLTRPLSRMRLYIGRVLASLSAVLAFSVASILSAIPIAAIAGIDFIAGNHFKMLVVGFSFGAAIVGLASLAGTLYSERGKTYLATGGVLILMYVFNIIAKLKDGLSGLQYFSLFHYLDASSVLAQGTMPWSAVFALLYFAVLTIIAGALIFQRRDIHAAA